MSIATWVASRATGGGGAAAPVVSIDADGFQATYNGTPPSTILNEPFTATGVPGFDANGSPTTRTLALRTTKRLRNPGLVTLQATKVGLSVKVPRTASVSGCTNNSTQIPPQPIANWITPFNRVIGNGDRIVDIVAFHYYGVACVEVTMTDGVTTLTQRTAAMIDVTQTGDIKAVYAYRVTFPAASVATLADGPITYNAKVYPTIGESTSVADSANFAARGFPVWKFAPRYDIKDPTRAASPFLAYLSTTGNDTTGVWSDNAATAAASPFLTYAGALATAKTAAIAAGSYLPSGYVDGCEIRAGAGSFALTSAPANNMRGGALIVTRDPAASRATAIYTLGAAWLMRVGNGQVLPNFYGPICFRDCTFSRTANVLITPSTTRGLLEFDSCTVNGNSVTGTWGTAALDRAYWGNGTSTGMATASMTPTAGGGFVCIRGNDFTMNGGNVFGYNIVGSRFANPGQLTVSVSLSPPDNSTICFSVANGDQGTTMDMGAGTTPITGFALVGYVSEWTTTTTNPAWRVSADAGQGSMTHILSFNNTFAGANDCGRHNDLYVDADSPAGSPTRVHLWCRSENNIFVQDNSKHDLFTPANAARVGGWETYLGCGYNSNFAQYRDAGSGSFAREFPGPNSIYSNTNADARGTAFDPRFKVAAHTTWNGSVYSTGSGNGDYRLQRISQGDANDSPCLTMAEREILPGFGTVIGAYP